MGVGNAVQFLLNLLNRISHNCLLFQIRDMYQVRLSILKVLNRHLHDLLCILASRLGVETDKVRIRHLRNRRCGDELGVETLAQRS